MIEITAERNNGIPPHEHGLLLLDIEIKKRSPKLGEYRIIRNSNGKPSIETLPDFHYNISHSGEWTVIALSDSEVGIDIQYIRPLKNGFAERFFTRRENEHLVRLSESDKIYDMIRIWTLKEARIKVSGESLAKNIKNFDTIAYDTTWTSSIKGFYVQTIPFPDVRYILSCSSPGKIESNYILRIN